MDQERVVLLGCVQEKQSVNDNSPYACKAGGKPAWYGSDAPVEAASMQCPRCKKQLYMVAQVYAPVDTDRTLYVFGCNSAECTEVAGSWRVLRDEAAPKEASLEPSSLDAVEQVTAQMSAVKVTSGWADTSDGEDSDWSDDDDDNEQAEVSCQPSGEIDLEQLLNERDAAMTLTKDVPSNSAKPKPDTETAPPTTLSTADAFPAMTIEVLDEPFEDYTSENDFSYENRLLQDYIKQEEEDESTDVNDLRRIISTAKKSTPAAASSAAAGSSGESYEKTPASQKHFMRFQKRINRCPLQCLRYDYGGEPLWPVTIPQSLKVPVCACGAERVFEFQLLPTINYFLKVDQVAAAVRAAEQSSHDSSEANTSPAAAIAGGMDWMSLMIYSCPQSCLHSREEVVFVLPSPKS